MTDDVDLAVKCESCGWRRGAPMCHHYPTDTKRLLLRHPVQSARTGHWLKTCRRCGEELTNPESIERGYGPACWEIVRRGGAGASERSRRAGDPGSLVPQQRTPTDTDSPAG